MNRLSYLLITDGTSDRALTYILNWLLHELLPDTAIEANWFDPSTLPANTKQKTLAVKIEHSLERFQQMDILFIHRDAENQSPQLRREEITKSLDDIGYTAHHICLIPIRMMEAWLLIDEESIRYAAGNPTGRVSLRMPSIKRLEDLSDPKETLYDLLELASEAQGRRLKQFKSQIPSKIQRLAELIEDYSLLRQLSAFQNLEADLRALFESMNPRNI